jgi:hypothetical protein
VSGALQAGVTSALVKKVSVTGTSLQVEFHTNLDLSAVDEKCGFTKKGQEMGLYVK